MGRATVRSASTSQRVDTPPPSDPNTQATRPSPTVAGALPPNDRATAIRQPLLFRASARGSGASFHTTNGSVNWHPAAERTTLGAVGSAPFPVMQAAYKDRALTEQEVAGLVAFLQYADSVEYQQLPRDYGLGLFLTGIAGAAVLFILFGTVWRGRRTGSVNQAIYDRQIKSVSETQ